MRFLAGSGFDEYGPETLKKTEAKQLAWQGFCPPNPTRRPLACFLIQSFFYEPQPLEGTGAVWPAGGRCKLIILEVTQIFMELFWFSFLGVGVNSD